MPPPLRPSRLRSVRRRALALAALVLAAVPAVAAFPGLASASAAAADVGTLWRVRDGAGTVFIAGSLHQLRRDRAGLPPSYGLAYGEAERLAMELDMDGISPAVLAGELVTRALDPDGRSLRDGLPAASWRTLQPRLAGLGLPEAVIDRFEPWAVALLLASAEFLQRGYSPESGVEGQLQASAAADRKPIDGLETPAEQFELFDGLPRTDQVQLLEVTLKELDGVGPRLDALEGAWRAGDLQRLEALLLGDYRQRPDLHERLVLRRNAAWVAPVRGFLRRPDDTLVVVGLMHLLGERGLIALLRQQGLKPERFVAGAWRPDP
ncbi:TraB/GumN family protein [Cyanobium gracile UHCC 0139]|uniref:TraB/GumN family protein n=1 Tax=Cyanobium gracile UHCC 0139 TaxID=3110308 RepID=A0ABU5RW03_9CYAN|nr:TraB/GumN family protein [Cyanobium gracile]MEA5391954.1 TraB/GumN family protein [Cyanobium gracile UHCC 0139]